MTKFAATLILVAWFAATANAGPGHDHDHGAAAGPEPIHSIPRIESTGSDLELLATADGHKLTIYLDRLATNEPVAGAKIDVSGEGLAATATETAPGTYEVESDVFDLPGTKALVFTVAAGDTIDLLNGTLKIEGSASGEQLRANDNGARLSGVLPWAIGGLAFAAGFFISFLFRPLHIPSDEDAPGGANKVPERVSRPERLRRAAEVVLIALLLNLALAHDSMAGPGHDHGDAGHDSAADTQSGSIPRRLPDGEVFVPKPSQRLLAVRTMVAKRERAKIGTELIGTVIPEPASSGQVQAPMDGQIEISDRGIAFVGQRVKAGDVLALLSPTIPVFDRGSLQQLTAEVEGKLRIAEQRLSRLTRIAGVVAQRDIDDTKAELEALREQKRVLAPKSAEKLMLKAPVSGVISEANVRPGQVVTARDTLFEIVDPDRLWVEANGTNVHDAAAISAAHAIDLDGHVIELVYVGQSPKLHQQLLQYLFQIKSAHAGLAIGANVKVIAQRDAESEGIVVPEAAVVRGANGLAQVWVKEQAERFRPASVRTLPLDGSRVMILAGIEDGSRVVTVGAELINQIR